MEATALREQGFHTYLRGTSRETFRQRAGLQQRAELAMVLRWWLRWDGRTGTVREQSGTLHRITLLRLTPCDTQKNCWMGFWGVRRLPGCGGWCFPAEPALPTRGFTGCRGVAVNSTDTLDWLSAGTSLNVFRRGSTQSAWGLADVRGPGLGGIDWASVCWVLSCELVRPCRRRHSIRHRDPTLFFCLFCLAKRIKTVIYIV